MKFNIPDVYNTNYIVLHPCKLNDIQVTQARDLGKANKSVYYNDRARTLVLVENTIFKVISMHDTSLRIEIITCIDKWLNHVKVYLDAEELGKIEIEPYK